jgi:ADP-ribosyl-[dinitrogen reductase] hydrolase
MNASAGPPENVRRDRAVGAVLASAAGDALGAPHEFGPALSPDTVLKMTGGGSFGWAPGEWTDDTQTALAVLGPLARAANAISLLDDIESGLLAWKKSDPPDIGNQTRAVLSAAVDGKQRLADVTATWQEKNPESAGNGSLMRTGPVALTPPSRTKPRPELARLASEISALTHANDDAIEACVLWTDAIRRAIDAPVSPNGDLDWVRLVAAGLDLVVEGHRDLWTVRLEACASTEPEEFTSNGWVVEALQAALSTLVHTAVPTEQPCQHLRLAIERAVRIGNDTDTVAAITGSLAGAWWGATAVPLEWRGALNGRIDYRTDPLHAGDLDRLARLAYSGGESDSIGWPAIDSLLPYYQKHFPSQPLAEGLDDWVTVGNVHALPDQLPQVDAVVSLCRMGRFDVPADIEHQVIGLLDTTSADNPNLDFVLADTADFMTQCAKDQRRVFVHCVQAQNRTPAVASAYLVRSRGIDPVAAMDQVEELTHSRPHPFLAEGVRSLAR